MRPRHAKKICLDPFRTVGANAIATAFGEVFSALKTRAIDGQENRFVTTDTMRISEVQRLLTATNRANMPFSVLYAKQPGDRLSADEKKALVDFAVVGCDEQRPVSRELPSRSLPNLRRQRMQITGFSPAELTRFRQAVEPVYDRQAASIGTETLEWLNATLAAVRRWAVTRGNGGKHGLLAASLPSGSAGMRITGVTALRVAEFANVLRVQLDADQGLSGFGEALMGAATGEAYPHEWAAPRLVGKHAGRIGALMDSSRTSLGWSGSGVGTRGKSALDIAAEETGGWDISPEELRAALEPFRKIHRSEGDRMDLMVEFASLWPMPIVGRLTGRLAGFDTCSHEDPFRFDIIKVLATYRGTARPECALPRPSSSPLPFASISRAERRAW